LLTRKSAAEGVAHLLRNLLQTLAGQTALVGGTHQPFTGLGASFLQVFTRSSRGVHHALAGRPESPLFHLSGWEGGCDGCPKSNASQCDCQRLLLENVLGRALQSRPGLTRDPLRALRCLVGIIRYGGRVRARGLGYSFAYVGGIFARTSGCVSETFTDIPLIATIVRSVALVLEIPICAAKFPTAACAFDRPRGRSFAH
jgi:hypothetical protein